MKLQSQVISGLKCHIADELDEGVKPRVVVVLCHGFGAPGTDLVPLGQMLLRQPKLSGSVQFVFPEAPLSLESQGMPEGRAWWPIDMHRLQMAVALGNFRDLSKDSPPELSTARERISLLIRQWSEQTGVPLSHFVLGGFSQGAMLATDVTLHLDENPGGLILWSGTMLNEEVWRKRAPLHKGLRVLQSHGTNDLILPFAAAGWLKEMLSHAGADVDFLPFTGSHEIPHQVLSRLSDFLRELVGDGRTHH